MRAVILTFKDNSDAEAFVRQVAERGGIVETGHNDLPAKVEAVIAVPTKSCTCALQDDTGRQRRSRSKRESGWVRGTALGWWLCINCHRPSKAMVRHFIGGMLNGANDLLPQILETGEPLTPRQRYERDGGVGTPQLKVGNSYQHL